MWERGGGDRVGKKQDTTGQGKKRKRKKKKKRKSVFVFLELLRVGEGPVEKEKKKGLFANSAFIFEREKTSCLFCKFACGRLCKSDYDSKHSVSELRGH